MIRDSREETCGLARRSVDKSSEGSSRPHASARRQRRFAIDSKVQQPVELACLPAAEAWSGVEIALGPRPQLDQKPLVTVIMSVFPAGEHLREAIESVLVQTHDNLEILVIDDGNPPGSMAVIREFEDERVRILRQDRLGKAAALNRALTEARGEFYAIQDADDVSDPRRIEVQLRAMLAEPDLACVFCGFDLILEGTRVAPLHPEKSIADCRRAVEAFHMPGHDPTAMFRTGLVRDIRYIETLAIGQGFDHILRVGERHPMQSVGECLYSYRVDRLSHSRRDPIRREEFVRVILSRACARRGIAKEDGPELLRCPPRDPESPRDRENNIAAHFIESALHLRRIGRFGAALRTAWICARSRPLDPHYWKALVFVVSPGPMLRLLRRRARRLEEFGASPS